jgi:hypothetical protein
VADGLHATAAVLLAALAASLKWYLFLAVAAALSVVVFSARQRAA